MKKKNLKKKKNYQKNFIFLKKITKKINNIINLKYDILVIKYDYLLQELRNKL
jgi:hypothetical protein